MPAAGDDRPRTPPPPPAEPRRPPPTRSGPARQPAACSATGRCVPPNSPSASLCRRSLTPGTGGDPSEMEAPPARDGETSTLRNRAAQGRESGLSSETRGKTQGRRGRSTRRIGAALAAPLRRIHGALRQAAAVAWQWVLEQGTRDADLVRVPRAVGVVPGGRDRVQPGLARRLRHQDQLPVDLLRPAARVAACADWPPTTTSIDILAMDVDWTAEFATAKWLKPVSAPLARPDQTAVDLAGPVQDRDLGNNRLWAVLINSNTELLWYRKRPPRPTSAEDRWTEMIADANQLAAKGEPHYIEEQGAQYEGLTVWFNSMVDSAGGQILTAGDKVVLNSAAVKAAGDHARPRDLQGRRPVAERLAGGPGTGGVPERHRRVHDQLSVRLVGDPGGQPQACSRTWGTPTSRR